MNEYWKWTFDNDRIEIKDIVDKKQVCLYGISGRKINVSGGRFYSEVLDPHDILFDRWTDPTDIDRTAQIIIHQHIYKTLSDIHKNKFYDETAIKKIAEQFLTKEGKVLAQENNQALIEKNQRMQDMGVPDVVNPTVGETIVELKENFVRLTENNRTEIYLAVECMSEILMVKTLEEVIGKTKDNFWRDNFPFIFWSDDIERTDIYPDGVADIIRTPNKIVNAWVSQLVENRTLRNFGMNYYDGTASENFVPQSFIPEPWGWYPTPGDPNKITKRVDIPDLSDSLDEILFIIGRAESASAATATEKGNPHQGQITLGEIKLTEEKALERITSVSKFYRLANKEFALKWYKMVEANSDYLDPVRLFKKSYKGNYFEKEIAPVDWKDEVGYEIKISTPADKESTDLKQIQKLRILFDAFPNNTEIKKIYQKKLINLVGLNPDEEKSILDVEQKMAETAMNAANPGSSPTNNSVIMPTSIENKIPILTH